jgi:ankyrin repeat protein
MGIARLLIENGADVNGQHGNALRLALYAGHEEIIQLLREKGTEINEQGGEYGDTLHREFRGGQEDISQKNIGQLQDQQGYETGDAEEGM